MAENNYNTNTPENSSALHSDAANLASTFLNEDILPDHLLGENSNKKRERNNQIAAIILLEKIAIELEITIALNNWKKSDERMVEELIERKRMQEISEFFNILNQENNQKQATQKMLTAEQLQQIRELENKLSIIYQVIEEKIIVLKEKVSRLDADLKSLVSNRDKMLNENENIIKNMFNEDALNDFMDVRIPCNSNPDGCILLDKNVLREIGMDLSEVISQSKDSVDINNELTSLVKKHMSDQLVGANGEESEIVRKLTHEIHGYVTNQKSYSDYLQNQINIASISNQIDQKKIEISAYHEEISRLNDAKSMFEPIDDLIKQISTNDGFNSDVQRILLSTSDSLLNEVLQIVGPDVNLENKLTTENTVKPDEQVNATPQPEVQHNDKNIQVDEQVAEENENQSNFRMR